MTELYNQFLEKGYRNLDKKILYVYQDYNTGGAQDYNISCSENDELDEGFVLYENTEKWFEDVFMGFYYGACDPIEWKILKKKYNLCEFKKELIIDLLGWEETYVENMIAKAKACDDSKANVLIEATTHSINTNFVDYYFDNILTFDRFKNILYENEEYNEVFADEVDLK